MTEEQQQQEIHTPSAGELLRKAREQMRLTQQQVADKLHLRQGNIDDIEQNRVDPKVSLTFTKGYLKIYAKLVNVAEQQVLDAFEREHQESKPAPAKLQSFSRRVAKQANDDRLMLVTYVVAIALVGLFILWWLQQSDQTSVLNEPMGSQESIGELNQDTQQSEVLSSESAQNNADQVLAGENSQQEDDLPQDNFSSTNDNESAQNLQSNLIEPVIAEQFSEQEEDQDGDTIELVFEFADDCWMNLTDSTGERIAYGVKKAGRVMVVSGIPPFEVTLGAPSVVQISYAGEPVDMTQFPTGRSANFSLPQAQQ